MTRSPIEPRTFLQLSRPMRRFWAARRGTYIIYEELVSWPAQAWGVGWGCLFLDFNTPSLPCGLHSTYHPLRPGSLQWTRCPNSQSDPGKLQPILPKPFEKKQIPSSSDINERDRRWPEDHRDAGPSDRWMDGCALRFVGQVGPPSTAQIRRAKWDIR